MSRLRAGGLGRVGMGGSCRRRGGIFKVKRLGFETEREGRGSCGRFRAMFWRLLVFLVSVVLGEVFVYCVG